MNHQKHRIRIILALDEHPLLAAIDFTQIFSEMLFGNGRPSLSRRGLTVPRLQISSAPTRPNRQATRREIRANLSRANLRSGTTVGPMEPMSRRNGRGG